MGCEALRRRRGAMLACAAALVWADAARGQVISTVAGTGTGGYNGDGGDATAAMLHWPWHLALDAAGDVLVADDLNSRIRRVSISGGISTVAGTGRVGFSGDGGPATSADLNYPRGVAVDGSGAVYIADTDNCRVRVVAANGTIATVAGTGVCGYGGDGSRAVAALLNGPKAVALTGGGELLIADTGNHCIRRVAVDGTISTVAGNGSGGYNGDGAPATRMLLNFPQGLCCSIGDAVYISDSQQPPRASTVPRRGAHHGGGDGGGGVQRGRHPCHCCRPERPHGSRRRRLRQRVRL